ncbi:MAG TPA: accessory factor UbiK family protein [Candidatus Binatia bacterium]|nr:accessory factor UbiK family protein [Candidatus Binatia bacterium]
MIRQQIFDEINQRLKALFEQSPAKDLEKNLRAMLQDLFSRLDLVTREDFDVQSEVLKRTREKLDQLESRIAQLEADSAKAHHAPLPRASDS